jgi:hypothetical protein
MKKLLFISLLFVSSCSYPQYIYADDEYYRNENNGIGQGGNGNGNGGVGNGNGNGNAIPEAPIDNVYYLIGLFLILSFVIIKYERQNS